MPSNERIESMHVLKRLSCIAIAIFCCTIFAQQSTPYVLTSFPLAAIKADTLVEIRWAGSARPELVLQGVTPDSGIIYYDRAPGGSDLGNYRYQVTNPTISNTHIQGSPSQRQIYFNPSEQTDMNAGVFYFIVGWPMPNDTFYSNELQLIVETTEPTKLTEPSQANIEDLTPTFEWEINPGVPYYHIILSDEKIQIDSSGEELNVEGLSIIWQAITPNTQIVYGAPDPSGTITASPPPMSPGQTYSIVVLNNYGNHPAYTSTKFGLPKTFTIAGDEDDTLIPPVNASPAGISTSDSSITFKWTSLDTAKANTYKIYVYVANDLGGVKAQLVVWENEVTAQTFQNDDGTWIDTAFVTIDAQSVLTENHYTWKVIAIDDRGAGRAGDTTGFDYTSPSGVLRCYTKEKIVSGNDTITSNVSAVEIQVEVLDGSLEKPLLFYTDNNGYLKRDRPVGTYRITAVKNGFEQQSKTIVIEDDKTTEVTLYLKRPDATVYGKVVDESGAGINLAKVKGISEKGDTLYAETDKFGSFILSCYKSDWKITAEKIGYITSLPRDTFVTFGQNVNFSSIALEKVPFQISGTVKNNKGRALIGVKVQLLREGVVVDELPSTSQTGVYSFSAEAGTYKLEATKTGFTTYSKEVQLSSSSQINITMQAGAALVNGYVFGRSWVSGKEVIAPITKATLTFTNVMDSTQITSVQSDATYGDFRISLPGDENYAVTTSAKGYVTAGTIDTVKLKPGKTKAYNDTLQGLAMIRGVVNQINDTTGATVGTVGNASISLVNTTTGRVSATATSQANGEFELRNIADDNYVIKAGKDGLVLDSVAPVETLEVKTGKITNATQDIQVFMVAGTKTIKWSINNGIDLTSSIKIQSPLEKTIKPTDSLTGAGSGDYVVIVDAVEDSIIDLAYHAFTVPDTVETYTDDVQLSVFHTPPDTVDTLKVTSLTPLDTVTFFYRSISSPTYTKQVQAGPATSFSFAPLLEKDGNYMVYYFVCQDTLGQIYGYEREAYKSYVKPNPLYRKLEIIPASSDTATYPADYDLTLRFQAYFSSAFIKDSTISRNAVQWSIENPQGTTLNGTDSTLVTVTTASRATTATSGPVVVKASIVDASKMWPGVSATAYIAFHVASQGISKIAVSRTDPANPLPITTAPGDYAQFNATATDSAGSQYALTPTWSIQPANAGTIAYNGVFSAHSSFAGRVQIYAKGGTVTGQYNVNTTDAAKSGLEVQHIVSRKSIPDTINSFRGARIVLPPFVVGANETGKMTVTTPPLSNLIERGLGAQKAIGQAYEINEVNGIALQLSDTGSAEITLDMPESHVEAAAGNKMNFSIARWHVDSLRWDTLSTSQVAANGKTISATLTRFSRFGILAEAKKTEGFLSVWPNPFSPFGFSSNNNKDYYRQAVSRNYKDPYNESDIAATAGGTWIRFKTSSKENFAQARVRIYTVLGDLVYAVSHVNLRSNTDYFLWWDGKTTEREIELRPQSQDDATFYTPGKKLCRNGRYFVVLMLKDTKGKKRYYKQQVILIK
ncbi:MAG: hypothetical protein GF398_13970 [Chitinivibrionales bacterium]|nr:hypothetical protein [Chitinivibrionales bacterium]